MSYYRRYFVSGGIYFFTVVLANRRSTLLCDEIAQFKKVYRQVTLRYPFVTEAICVLPEHLHAIWQLPSNDADYPKRWSLIKNLFSRHCPSALDKSISQVKKQEKGIWQRRYWEHLIRDEEDLQRHIDYIHYNPVKHGLVTQVKDWPYSSFHRYVREGRLPDDWCGVESEGLFGE